MKKHSTENNRLPLRQILIGLFVTMLTALAGAGLVAYLTLKGVVGEGSVKMTMVIMNLLAGFAGCLTSVLLSKKSILLVGGIVAAGYAMLLLCANLLFFDGAMDGVFWTVIMIVTGTVAGILVSIRGLRTKKRSKYSVRK